MTATRPLPMASKGSMPQVAIRSVTTDQLDANKLARELGCRVVERYWPEWPAADTLNLLTRWTQLLEEKRAYLGRPLRREIVGYRSDYADIERLLRVPVAHLAYNAKRFGLPAPATKAWDDLSK